MWRKSGKQIGRMEKLENGRKTINERIIKWRNGQRENVKWNNDTRMIHELKSTDQ